MEFTTNITSGIAPLQVFFSVTTSNITPVSYQMDFEGDGVTDYTGTTFEDINHTYTTVGVYYPKVTVTDSFGNNYSDTIAITVLLKTDVAALLREKWEGLKAALMGGDVEKAVKYFVAGGQNEYRQIFTGLSGDDINSIFSGINEFEIDTLSGRVAECGVDRVEAGGTYSYPVTYVRDENGIWMIMGF